jgi:hypothetical protein
MATITLTIPDAVLTRVTTAFTSTRAYNPATDGTPGQFTKAQILKFVKDVVVASESNTAASAAALAAAATANTDIQLT